MASGQSVDTNRRAEISLPAGQDAVEEKLGRRYRRVDDLKDDPTAPRAASVSRESVGDAEGALAGGLFYVRAAAPAGAANT